MRYTVRKRKPPIKAWIIIILMAGICLYGFYMVDSHLKPTILTIAEAKVRVKATEAINSVIYNEVSQKIDYQSLVSVRVDNRGRVVLMQPNTIEFNRLASDTTMKIQQKLNHIQEEKIEVPFGQVLGSQLLASIGPHIVVTVIPIGTVNVKVVDKFEQAGINQTKHMIYLATNAQIRIVVPLVSKIVDVSTRVLVSEYVVVGEVPTTYVQIPYPFNKELLNSEE